MSSAMRLKKAAGAEVEDHVPGFEGLDVPHEFELLVVVQVGDKKGVLGAADEAEALERRPKDDIMSQPGRRETEARSDETFPRSSFASSVGPDGLVHDHGGRNRVAQTGHGERGKNGTGGLYFFRVSDMLNHSF